MTNSPLPTATVKKVARFSEAEAALFNTLYELIEEGKRDIVLDKIHDWHPADIAPIVLHLPYPYARQFFQWLPTELASGVLAELDDEFRTSLLSEATVPRLTPLLEELDTDDAADVLSNLPPHLIAKLLPTLSDSSAIAQLLTYEEDSAGGIMAAHYVAVPNGWSVRQAIEAVRRHADQIEELSELFVVNEHGHLLGSVSLKDLLLAVPMTPITQITDTDVVSVPTDMDQEEVALVMERYDMLSLPVVDDSNCLVGCITIDDVVDVIREEAEEDQRKMGGISADEQPTSSVWQIVRGRLPWLLGGLLGAGLAATVVGSFESELQRAVILASFIPIVMAMAGNAGIQSATIAVQGLASGEVWSSDLLPRLSKELLGAVVNGLVVAVTLIISILLFSTVMNFDNPLKLALTSSLSLFLVVIIAASLGATIPLLLHRFGIDPAVATGVFITTGNDIIGVFIFFVIATQIYL
ncbi:magnesium transporter [Candidatus Venteria ishoeyi]|uniref:magnesium transporter n=1 Tax=Candidatus Venteria ishoeyi TaxID=1899563 RepID=UPI0025A508C7|nr:magnesium transporter [Candidatus Venteria ishoeyi]MDM8546647.1 magnesium transporter [Candidatus Venteria ishoeyi]